LKRPSSVNRKHQLGKDPLSGVARTASTTSLPPQPPTLTKDQGRLEIHDAGHTSDHSPGVWPPLLALASRTRDPDQAAHALLLCQAATAVKQSVGWFIEVKVLNTTLVMWRLSARIASVFVLPSAPFLAT
jgi:hypothetical protein